MIRVNGNKAVIVASPPGTVTKKKGMSKLAASSDNDSQPRSVAPSSPVLVRQQSKDGPVLPKMRNHNQKYAFAPQGEDLHQVVKKHLDSTVSMTIRSRKSIPTDVLG